MVPTFRVPYSPNTVTSILVPYGILLLLRLLTMSAFGEEFLDKEIPPKTMLSLITFLISPNRRYFGTRIFPMCLILLIYGTE